MIVEHGRDMYCVLPYVYRTNCVLELMASLCNLGFSFFPSIVALFDVNHRERGALFFGPFTNPKSHIVGVLPSSLTGKVAAHPSKRNTTKHDTVLPTPSVTWGPKIVGITVPATKAKLFPLLATPNTSWPTLAARTSTFKLFLDVLRPNTPSNPNAHTDDELRALIEALKRQDMEVGVEIGGARWQAGRCDVSAALAYAAGEQAVVGRWLKLGGTIDRVTTDHACLWNVRRNSNPNPNPHKAPHPCDPAVPMATRIDIVAQIFASWRTFLGVNASLGFIESLGFWDIEGPDGTNFTNSDPGDLNSKCDVVSPHTLQLRTLHAARCTLHAASTTLRPPAT